MNNSARLTGIPTHLLAGPLGAGKTSTLQALLGQRPADERWAVLINEFGQIGLDAALLSEQAGEDVHLAEVAGGCLCCVNGTPFQIALGRLLRQARPQRLFIEPSGLGHPQSLLEQLRAAPWRGVLAVQPLVMVLDAQALADEVPLAPSQQATLPEAGLLVLNKSEALDAAQRQALLSRLPHTRVFWTHHGRLPLVHLPGADALPGPVDEAAVPEAPPALPRLWRDPGEPECRAQGTADGWSIGWRWHPSQRFDLARLDAWLATLDWTRAKLIVQTAQGPRSTNRLGANDAPWRDSEWRRDSRFELIFAEERDAEALQRAVQACRESS
ncbi:CobW family GTP-binding protein [Stutzerimonas azotifigens]|uniref:CobW family GTP-binding protein n=1 Tax=Stutzerimonas azotifigens TaxID=291995 RepID=UPI0004156302|nr:GTP-binding protein [Stutzerimonas azotifigens]